MAPADDNCFSVRMANTSGASDVQRRWVELPDVRGRTAAAGQNAAAGTKASILAEVVQGIGVYPQGSKLLQGTDRLYIISPLTNIVEEAYTAYFEFTLPE
jgi:hypothetical protein